MRAAVQKRSKVTEGKILAAVHDLLAEGRLEEVSVAEIAQRAGVSIGGFYARFPTKGAAVIKLCDQAFLDDYIARTAEAFAPERWPADAPAARILEAYVRLAVETFRTNRILLAEVARWSRASPDPEFRARVSDFGRRIHGIIRPLLLAHSSQIKHASPGLAIDLGMIAVAAVIRETILFGDERPDIDIDDETLIRELTALLIRYLQC